MISAIGEKTTKISTLLLEIVFIVIGILKGINILVYFSVNPITNMNDLISHPDFSLFISSLLIIFIAPSIVAFALNKSNQFMNKIYENKFQTNFFKNEGSKRVFNVTELSVSYKVSNTRIKEILSSFVSEGLLRGRFEGFGDDEQFIVDPDFEVKPIEDKRKEIFQAEILDYLKPYKVIPLSKISHSFRVNKSYVEKQIHQMISEKKIIGFMDEGNLFRDLSVIMRDFSEMASCKSCFNKLLPGSEFCSFCGKPLMND